MVNVISEDMEGMIAGHLKGRERRELAINIFNFDKYGIRLLD